MIGILQEAKKKKMARGGKPHKQRLEDCLLMALEYWREYRTYFHIATSFGIAESSCFRNIRWVEDTLSKHPDLKLPSKKQRQKSDMQYEVIVVDACETPIERPKKNNISTTLVKKSDTL